MSTTRKIEGYLTAHDDNGPGYELGSGAGFGSFWEQLATKFLPEALPVTLVIGGKAFTEDEVNAIVGDLYSAAMDGPYLPNTKRMDECLAKHGIQLP